MYNNIQYQENNLNNLSSVPETSSFEILFIFYIL